MVSSVKDELSEERKRLQSEGLLPEFYTTAAWQMFKSKYAVDGEQAVKGRFETIAKTLAKHTIDKEQFEKIFFDLMWSGKVSPSTPMLANTGTDRGMPVSCSGGYVADSIDGFYSARREVALLSKYGFGTSSYLGDIRQRGSNISIGGKASGILPELKAFVQTSRDVSQGANRRGAWAGYIPIDHGDFWEIVNYLHKNPDDLNIGWNISDDFIQKLESGDTEALARFKRSLKVKAETGKGYYFFVDKVNKQNPKIYQDKQLKVLASNLCTEITLYSNDDETYTCVLLSINASKWGSITDEDIRNAHIMLHCVAKEFIEKAEGVAGLEKAVLFTKKNMALGMGLLGWHTLLQEKMIPFESLEAQFLNTAIWKRISAETLKASQWLAEVEGEPENCKGYGVANSHRTSVAPNMSSAILMGGVSQGIEPIVANVFNQGSAVGEIERVNPTLLKLLKERDQYKPKVIQSIIDNKGSVQHLDFLTEHEKLVFKTAFEINQEVILRLASQRQKYICQAQSLNLFFDADEDEGYIAQIHKQAFLDPNIKSLYYMRTLAGVQASKGECVACEG